MGTGYTRNDTANNIADGNVINASDLDGEFDAIQGAFNGTTGHSHDGTSGEGPLIAAGGIASNAVTTAKILDANVTTAKIADANVTTAKIANDAVTGDKLANNIQIAGTLGVTGETTLTTHLNMGDSDIIKLGASADLGLYHDGSNSYIDANGAGNLNIRQRTNDLDVFIQSDDGSGGEATYFQADGSSGEAKLFHYGSQKIATTASGVSVTGNVVVSGTVDGRDVASDGTKLDGIESGATADQTASEILTLIKTVDGAGSGLDADTLDGVTSGSFLRSDAADTKTSGHLAFSDNVRAQFGTSQDLQIYHDTSNSYIVDGGTGNLLIQGSNVIIERTTGENIFGANGSTGQATLYYNGSTKLQTVSGGVEVTGELQADSLDIDGAADISGQVNLHSNLVLDDQDKIIIGNGSDLQIYHDATGAIAGTIGSYIQDAGTGNLFIRGTNLILEDSSGNDYIVCTDNGTGGTVELKRDTVTKLTTTTDGISVSGNVTATSGGFIGATSNDKIVVGANDIDFTINGSNEFRMQSDGDFHADGDVIAFSTTVSDERLKTDIEKIENATDKVSQLNGYTFTYKADGKKSAGVIAQEVEKVLPSAVREKELPLKMDDGVAYKTVQYDQIIGLLIESIKELKQEINELRGD